MKYIPKINYFYWISISIASVFGANAGDFLSDAVNLGHLNGIPILAVILLCIFLVEHFDKTKTALYYWSAIITVRAAATNIGDCFRDYHIFFNLSIPIVTVLILVVLCLWKIKHPKISFKAGIPVHTTYWISMFLAGVLGTLLGDYCSFTLKLGNFLAMIVLGMIVGVLLLKGRKGLQCVLFYYWTIIVFIRGAGTAAGDLFVHHYFGLIPSTIIFGIVFTIIITTFYVLQKNKEDFETLGEEKNFSITLK